MFLFFRVCSEFVLCFHVFQMLCLMCINEMIQIKLKEKYPKNEDCSSQNVFWAAVNTHLIPLIESLSIVDIGFLAWRIRIDRECKTTSSSHTFYSYSFANFKCLKYIAPAFRPLLLLAVRDKYQFQKLSLVLTLCRYLKF